MSENDNDVLNGAELYEKLLIAVDGGDSMRIGQYDASTILAMLEDAEYHKQVIAVHSASFG